MCGIVGYIGSRQAMPLVLGGLRRLEYRGYDSAGMAVIRPSGHVTVIKKSGGLSNLESCLQPSDTDGVVAIGHTRWATHGAPTDRNAHPHTDSSGRVAVVHNGIVENFAELRAGLVQAGVSLTSDTDSEVVAHL